MKESPKPVRKSKPVRIFVLAALMLSLGLVAPQPAQRQATAAEETPLSVLEAAGPAAAWSAARGDAGRTPEANASATTEQPRTAPHSLFERAPLGWDGATLSFIAAWMVALPERVPELLQYLAEKSVVLVLLGSATLMLWILTLLYRLAGRKKVFERTRDEMLPLLHRVPWALRLVVISLVKTVIASLIPLVLWGVVSLACALVIPADPWLLLTRDLLGLWVVGSLGIHLLRGVLAGNTFPSCPIYGQEIFQLLRLSLVYALLVVGLERLARAFEIRGDVLAFLQFSASLSIVVVFFLLFLKKQGFLSLLPDLPYKSYGTLLRLLDRFYFPLIFVTAAVGTLMCLGYKRLGEAFFIRTWGVGVAYVAVMASYHFVEEGLLKRAESKTSDEAAQYFFRSSRSLLRYTAMVTGALIILSLLGLLKPMQHIMSSPILTIGETSLSFWILVRAALVLLAFIYVSDLLQTYLDYKLYPSLGIETGLAYALNTSVRYLFIVMGLLFALRFMGVDLRVLMVLAGTAGIGIGFGLQSIVANMTSGLIIIFGRKLRKGDWVQVGDTVGVVSDIYLRATKVLTRDNIEFVIPNSDFIGKTIVNYTLTSPFIRVHVPVGVSYNADPRKVKEILLACADREPGVSHYDRPKVWFTEFGDSSINFELLVWTDVRRFSQKELRSRLNFQVFDALRKAGIEIPFPQREIRIRSALDQPASSAHPYEEDQDAAA